jgi:hypothetical protein
MASINSIFRHQLQRSVHEDSAHDAEVALAEILDNHRAAGRTVREGLHNGRPAWHVVTMTGGAYAVFWISDLDEGAWA